MTEVVYLIQNPPDLHKLFVRFSQPKSFNIFRIFDEYERLHSFRSHAIYNIRVRVVSDIQYLTFGSSLYIRYNTAAHVVNSTDKARFPLGDFFFCLLSSRLGLIKNLFNFHNSMSLREKKNREVENWLNIQ